MKKLTLLSAAITITLLAANSVSAAQTSLVSVSATGSMSADKAAGAPSVSANGRYVVFESDATNLGPINNSKRQIYRKDLLTGKVDMVSVSNQGSAGDSDSRSASISADGQKVGFLTTAVNLGASAGAQQVVMRNMTTSVTTVVSRNYSGGVGNGHSRSLNISADGRYVAFQSSASDIVTGDTNLSDDIFVSDLQTGYTERVSVSDAGAQVTGTSTMPVISADGRFVAYSSLAKNIVSGDPDDQFDVFLRDRSLNKTYLVSQTTSGIKGNGASTWPTVSDDGRYVSFQSQALNLTANANVVEVYLRDVVNGTTTLVSKDVNNGPADNSSIRPYISGNGRYISYATLATDIVTPDATAGADVVVYDRITGKTDRASVHTNGSQIEASIGFTNGLSYDGSVLAFFTNGSGIDGRDIDSLSDVYVRYRDLNTNPVANAGTYAAVECTGITTPVQLNGTGSTDADGDTLSYVWTVPAGTASGATPVSNFYRGSNQAISLTVDDGQGGKSTATSSVTVRDTQAPSVTLNKSIYLEAKTRTGTASTIAYTVNDGCDKSLTVNTAESANVTTSGFYPFVIGPVATQSSITVTAIDDSGNSTSKTANIFVDDTTAPVFTSQPVDVVAEATAVATPSSDIMLVAPTASDIFNVSISNNAPATFGLGSHPISWTATDENGNAANTSSQVIVRDTKAPAFQGSLVSVTKEATGPETAVILVTPGVDEIFLSSLDYSPKGPYPVGVHAVMWSATDTSGNNATSTQLVNITDTTAPELSIPANYIMEANGNPSSVGSLGVAATAVDLVDGDLSSSIVVTEPASGYQLGENTVAYTVADTRSNSVTKAQTIKVSDSTKPVFKTLLSDVTREAEAPTTIVMLSTPDVMDHYLDTVSHDAPDGFTFNVGDTPVRWTAVDTSGNTEIATQTVKVVDTTAPALTIPAGFSMEANGNPSLVSSLGVAPTAQDLVDLDVSANVVITQPANGYQLGDNDVVYSASDSRSNLVSKVQVVNIVDTTKPVFRTTLSNITREAEGAETVVSLITPDVFDFYLASVTHNAPAGFAFGVGSKLVTWSAVDTSANSSTAAQTVTIVDTTAPTLNVPVAITVEANGNPSNAYALGSATATDIVDGNVSSKIVVTEPAGGYNLGANTVSYSVTDNAGNTATGQQIVTVVDTTAPSLNAPLPLALIEVTATGELTTVDIGAVTAKDHYLDSVTKSRASSQFPVGETVVMWTAVDTSGNKTQYQQTVRVSYKFNGYGAPLNEGGIYKAGRTIPVKINLTYADGSPVTIAMPQIFMYQTSNQEVVGDALDINSSSASDAGTVMRSTGSNGDYIYNLDTSSMGKGTYQIAIHSQQSANAEVINIALK